MTTATPKSATAKSPRKVALATSDTMADADSAQSIAANGNTTVRLKELVERVTASTGGKKKGVREIVEATLTQLGLALQNGEMLNLPDFGRVRVAKGQGAAPGSAMTLKLRRAGDGTKKKAPDGASELALAAPEDHS